MFTTYIIPFFVITLFFLFRHLYELVRHGDKDKTTMLSTFYFVLISFFVYWFIIENTSLLN